MRQLIWTSEGKYRIAGCSDCGWRFDPKTPPDGVTLGEIAEKYAAQRERDFKQHDCSRFPKGKKE
jgi:hypothetical protein